MHPTAPLQHHRLQPYLFRSLSLYSCSLYELRAPLSLSLSSLSLSLDLKAHGVPARIRGAFHLLRSLFIFFFFLCCSLPPPPLVNSRDLEECPCSCGTRMRLCLRTFGQWNPTTGSSTPPKSYQKSLLCQCKHWTDSMTKRVFGKLWLLFDCTYCLSALIVWLHLLFECTYCLTALSV